MLAFDTNGGQISGAIDSICVFNVANLIATSCPFMWLPQVCWRVQPAGSKRLEGHSMLPQFSWFNCCEPYSSC